MTNNVGDAEIIIEADGSQALTDTERIARRIERALQNIEGDVGIRAELQRGYLEGALGEIERQVAAADPTVDVGADVDWSSLDRALRDIERRAAEADADVDVDTDVDDNAETTLGARLRAMILRVQARLNPIEIETRIDHDRITRGLSSIMSTGGRLAAMAAKGFGLASLGIVGIGAVPGILAAGAALTSLVVQLSGITALAPAAIGGLVAAFGTLKVGMSGFGDAMKNIGDPKKFAEALKALSPAARETALAVRSLAPAWGDLKAQVQDNLFEGMAEPIRQLGKAALPQLKEGMAGIATGWNALGKEGVGALTALTQPTMDVADGFSGIGDRLSELGGSAAKISPLSYMLGQTKTAMDTLKGAVNPVIEAFTDLGVVGSGYLPKMSQAIADAAKRFGDFIANARDTGQIKGWIDGAVGAFRALWGAVKDVASIIGSVVKAASASTGGLSGFGQALSTVADVMNGPAFQKGLTEFFSGFQAGMKGVLSAAPAIGSLLGALGPVLGQLAAQLGPVLGQAFTTLANAITPLIPALQPLIAALGPALTSVISALAPILTTIADLFARLAPAIAPVVTAIGSGLTAALTGIAPLISTLGTVIGNILVTALQTVAPLFPLLGQAIGQVGAALTPLLPMLGQIVQQILPLLGQLIAAILPVLGPLVQLIATGLAPVLQIVSTLLGLIAPIISANITAIGLLVTAVSSVITWFTNLVTSVQGTLFSWDAFKAKVSEVWSSVTGTIQAGLTWLSSFWTNTWSTIQSYVTTAWSIIQTTISSAVTTIRDTISNVFTTISRTISDTVNTIRSAVSNAFNSARDAAVNAFNTLRSGVSNAINGARSAVSDAVNSVKSAVSNGFNAAKSAATSAFDSLKSGVSNAINSAKNTVSSAVNSIKSAVSNGFNSAKSAATSAFDSMKSSVTGTINSLMGTISGIPGRITGALGNLGSLLVSKGAALIQGLIDGIMSKMGAVGGAISKVAGAIGRFLPSSPVKEGPLRAWNRGMAGKRLMGFLTDGIEAGQRSVVNATKSVVGAMNRSFNSGQFDALSTQAEAALSSVRMPNVLADFSKAIDPSVTMRGVTPGVRNAPNAQRVPPTNTTTFGNVNVTVEAKDLEAIKTVQDFIDMMSVTVKQTNGVRTGG